MRRVLVIQPCRIDPLAQRSRARKVQFQASGNTRLPRALAGDEIPGWNDASTTPPDSVTPLCQTGHDEATRSLSPE